MQNTQLSKIKFYSSGVNSIFFEKNSFIRNRFKIHEENIHESFLLISAGDIFLCSLITVAPRLKPSAKSMDSVGGSEDIVHFLAFSGQISVNFL